MIEFFQQEPTGKTLLFLARIISRFHDSRSKVSVYKYHIPVPNGSTKYIEPLPVHFRNEGAVDSTILRHRTDWVNLSTFSNTHIAYFTSLEQCPGNAGTHQAGDGAANQGLGTQFRKVSTLPRRQLADTTDLDPNRSKVGKA